MKGRLSIREEHFLRDLQRVLHKHQASVYATMTHLSFGLVGQFRPIKVLAANFHELTVLEQDGQDIKVVLKNNKVK